MARFRPGTVLFGKYRIERLLGRGGFAEVYLATHLHLDAPRALKVLTKGERVTTGLLEKVAQRFQLEARLGARFADVPYIVRVYDFEQDPAKGLLVLITEYMPGGSLKARIEEAQQQGQKGLPVDFVVATAYNVALGLAALHQAGLVHRDIKPSNILYDGQGRAKVADLGIVQQPHGLTQRTDLGETAPRHPGTPEYMSPEQEMTVGYLPPASDVYSLGVTLFEALTLRQYKHLRPGTRVRQLRPEVPAWLDDLIARMLARDPEARPWDGEELARLLKPYMELAPAVPTGDFESRPEHLTAEVHPVPETDLHGWTDGPSTEVVLPQSAGLHDRGTVTDGVARPSSWMLHHLRRLAPLMLTLGLLVAVLVGGWAITRSKIAPSSTYTPDHEVFSSPVSSASRSTTAVSVTRQRLPRPSPSPVPTPTPRLRTKVNPVDGAVMVYIPKGTFLMGLTPEQRDLLESLCSDEGCIELYEASFPAHQVEVSGFWIYQTEVTNGMYARCVAERACKPPKRRSSVTHRNYYGNPVYRRYPVTWVSWYQARDYCRWAGGRLPTSAEWEYAARGADGRLFPWGNMLPTPEMANVDHFYEDFLPVDSLPAGRSPFGLFHMTGNVWEWVQDWFSLVYYTSNTDWHNPQGPPEGDIRGGTSVKVGRGGNYWIRVALSSPAIQDWENPSAQRLGVGFRCVYEGE